MRYLSYILLSIILCSTSLDLGQLYACPRCRRAQPRGPLKKPTPPIPNPHRGK